MENYVNEMKLKKKLTVSILEHQNREELKAIEEKRHKFRNLPKSSKEKMDNNLPSSLQLLTTKILDSE